MIMLSDAKRVLVNVVHCSSTKSKRICKSVLTAKLFALVDGYDAAAAIRDTIQKSTGLSNIELVLYTDSKSLNGLCISLSPTTERRLQIDLALIRQAYETQEITKIIWTSDSQNSSDNPAKVVNVTGFVSQMFTTNTLQESSTLM